MRVALFGVGQVGAAFARQVERSAHLLEAEGVAIDLVGGLVRDAGRSRGSRDVRVALSTDVAALWASSPDVVVEALGGAEPARSLIAQALARGVSVVTANKTVVARHGAALARLAAGAGVGFAFEAAVVAGVPFVDALARRPGLARVRRVAGVLNGTSHVVLEAMTAGASFEAALASAVASGYAEPDAAADTSGRDAAEKLSILLALAGRPLATPELLPRLAIDGLAGRHVRAAARLGGVLKPIAWAEGRADGAAWVGPAFVDRAHGLASLAGVENAVEITAEDGGVSVFRGPGAGPEVTAVTLLDDVIEMVGGRPSPPRWHRRADGPPDRTPRQAPDGPWYLAADAATADLAADLASYLSARGLVVHRSDWHAGTLACLTWPAAAASVARVTEALRAAGVGVIAVPVCPGAADRSVAS